MKGRKTTGSLNKLVNQAGPKPGSNKAISQRKAVSTGYEAAGGERRTNTQQKNTKTGTPYWPGLTPHANGKR